MTVRWTVTDAAPLVRAPRPSDDKYSRGVLGVWTGSAEYPGAAVLGVEAAWRTGLGMVRYLGPAAELVLQRRPETVCVDGRVQARLVGSGMDAAQRSASATAQLRAALDGDRPVVVDAGALDLLPAAAPVIVTPHARELVRVRAALGLETEPDVGDDERVPLAVETAAALGGVVLLKGAVTVVAAADGWSARVGTGTSWLATAGTGDVLGGVIGALVAAATADAEQGGGVPSVRRLAALAATGALLHGSAAVHASSERGGGPITAMDVAEALPFAVAGLRQAGVPADERWT